MLIEASFNFFKREQYLLKKLKGTLKYENKKKIIPRKKHLFPYEKKGKLTGTYKEKKKIWNKYKIRAA